MITIFFISHLFGFLNLYTYKENACEANIISFISVSSAKIGLVEDKDNGVNNNFIK